MNDLPVGFHRAEQEWLQPPDQPDPITVIFRISVTLYPEGDDSAEQAFRRGIKNREIDIHDIEIIEADEFPEGWPVGGNY